MDIFLGRVNPIGITGITWNHKFVVGEHPNHSIKSHLKAVKCYYQILFNHLILLFSLKSHQNPINSVNKLLHLFEARWCHQVLQSVRRLAGPFGHCRIEATGSSGFLKRWIGVRGNRSSGWTKPKYSSFVRRPYDYVSSGYEGAIWSVRGIHIPYIYSLLNGEPFEAALSFPTIH